MAAPQDGTPPATTPAPAKKSPIDEQDLDEWKTRFNDALSRPGEIVKSKSAEDAQPWYARLFGCFSPVDTCLVACCLPCVTFGKTHHRVRKDGALRGYEPVNTSCLLFCATACLGVPCVPTAMQRMDIREKYNLQGSCLEDLALACCCHCCVIIQADKEAEHREELLRGGGVQQQYQANTNEMQYPPATD